MMMNKTFMRTLAVVALGAMVFAGQAQAGSVKAKFLKVGLGKSPAGFYHWQMVDQDNYNMPVDGKGQFTTFCIEYDQHVSRKAKWYEVINLSDAPNVPAPMGEVNAFKLRELFGRHYEEIDTKNEAVAFHHAIWNISHGRGTNNALAQQWLAELQGPGVYNGELANLKVLHHDKYQDQVFVTPLPAGAWAGMSMLSGLGLIRSIRRRRG